ncbi:glycoside hydrolase [Niastella vici]|uniref:Glycoside hydrolase n=1 Tax=Niastella vici TaxID=1703345 RepID=A0A1V9G783_9BACT|nr:glycosyl hydrolase family 65 protein [Niastella vici]OQP66404.1 glycoside hydrolase [Niastella vici]
MNQRAGILTFLFVLCVSTVVAQKSKAAGGAVLKAEQFRHYVDYFNTMEEENIAQAVPNAQAWDWLKVNIPLFECPQQNFEEIWYYRWWTLRKHLKQTPAGYAFTEFLINRNYADKYNLIGSALGHHIYEARWLRDNKYLNDYLHIWYRGNEGKAMNKLHWFSSWNSYALYNRYLVNGDSSYLLDLLPDLETDYTKWEMEKRLPNGLFWQSDVRDGMEETISGGRKEKNARPTINSYMYGNAMALSYMETLAGNKAKAGLYASKADSIKKGVQQLLWNAKDTFFETRKQADTMANVREEIGFIPWYFNLPDTGYEAAWKKITEESGFCAPFGLTTAERSHPQFRTHGCCKCEWDGAVWPYATAQTMTAMANLMNNYKQTVVNDSVYFRLMELYVESQYYRGRPYIGEYLDEKTGYWLKGDQERSRYYNHSTYNDLVITGLVGLRPRADNTIEVNPLVPEKKWDWFCLDNVSYHGKLVTIIWDKTGAKYKKGRGLSVWVNGKKKASAEHLQRVTGTIE